MQPSVSHSGTNAMRLGKRLLKNLPGSKADDIREQLKKLHKALIDKTIVNVDINTLRILGRVESIGERLEEHGISYVNVSCRPIFAS
jgi:hypothetical protein